MALTHYERTKRYRMTLRGRLLKREAASRYFQKHKNELYVKRATRMEGYTNDNMKEAAVFFTWTPLITNHQLRELAETPEVQLEARRMARVQHDWHPRATGDGPMGRLCYQWRNGKWELQRVGRYDDVIPATAKDYADLFDAYSNLKSKGE